MKLVIFYKFLVTLNQTIFNFFKMST